MKGVSAMSRLTKRDDDGMAIFADDELAKGCDVSGKIGLYWEKILNKLADYEDTGLTPDATRIILKNLSGNMGGWLNEA